MVKSSQVAVAATYHYRYDAAGNLIGYTVNDVTTRQIYNATEELTQSGSTPSDKPVVENLLGPAILARAGAPSGRLPLTTGDAGAATFVQNEVAGVLQAVR